MTHEEIDGVIDACMDQFREARSRATAADARLGSVFESLATEDERVWFAERVYRAMCVFVSEGGVGPVAGMPVVRRAPGVH